MTQTAEHTAFSSDLQFLQRFIRLVVLQNDDGTAKIAVSPNLQGRIMTSTAGAPAHSSYGWINRALFESGDTLAHMNAFGGEERLWLGPEGGQYSIFFQAGAPFDLEHWQTPRLIDLDPYEITAEDNRKVVFEKDATLTNYSGFVFDFNIERTVEILSTSEIIENLQLSSEHLTSVVGYQTTNKLTNTGNSDWKEETGLLSIWLLGMYNPTEMTTVFIPFQPGSEEVLGPVVNDTYFGKVSSERLKIKDGIIYFRGDGKSRGKIGLNPKRAKNLAGAYDAKNQVLTIIKYNKPTDNDRYVNSLWEIQDQPYAGDVINSYNDGPPEPGKAPLGPFFEVETSSPALALKKGETGVHIQETYHFEGDEKDLEMIIQKLFGVTLAEVKGIF